MEPVSYTHLMERVLHYRGWLGRGGKCSNAEGCCRQIVRIGLRQPCLLYTSGEPITVLADGRPLFVRSANDKFNLADFEAMLSFGNAMSLFEADISASEDGEDEDVYKRQDYVCKSV